MSKNSIVLKTRGISPPVRMALRRRQAMIPGDVTLCYVRFGPFSPNRAFIPQPSLNSSRSSFWTLRGERNADAHVCRTSFPLSVWMRGQVRRRNGIGHTKRTFSGAPEPVQTFPGLPSPPHNSALFSTASRRSCVPAPDGFCENDSYGENEWGTPMSANGCASFLGCNEPRSFPSKFSRYFRADFSDSAASWAAGCWKAAG